MTPVLYSTNVYLKYAIQRDYRDGVHYVWCSEHFDSTTVSRYACGSMVPPSSNPADIYRELRAAVERSDSHCSKIAEQKASLTTLAIKWEQSGEITTAQKEEIVYMVNNAPFDHWRPLIYVIPRVSVSDRLQLVPIEKRAGFGNEYIIDDLTKPEFELMEL